MVDGLRGNMYDINFYIKTKRLRNIILSGKIHKTEQDKIFSELETYRNIQPYVFNVETTNTCNMTCRMCPRTDLMHRKIKVMDNNVFEHLLDQIKPNKMQELKHFWKFIEDEQGMPPSFQHENAFYFYHLSKHLILHGYGEPLLDPSIIWRVQACTDRNIPTYFSCVAANINLSKMIALMKAGLDIIKFSIDSLTDEGQKLIRGKKNNFYKSFETIKEILEYKQLHPEIKTEIVVTMISFSKEENAYHEQKQFMNLWKQYPVYAYVKSQDNRWYYKENKNFKNQSHYEKQYCAFAWSSLSVLSNGDVVPCTQDYNAEMRMGNITKQSLKDIWNNDKYQEFRQYHITGKSNNTYKCMKQCDLPKLFQRYS